MAEPSPEAAAAAQALREFANDILATPQWRGSKAGPAPAIAAAAQSKASQIIAESTLENAQKEAAGESNIAQDLASLINRYSMDNPSGTPDFIVAEFMLNVLFHFDDTVAKRAQWRGESVELPALQKLHQARPDIFQKEKVQAENASAVKKLLDRTLAQPKKRRKE